MIPEILVIDETEACYSAVQAETPARMPVEAARAALEAALEDIMREALSWHKMAPEGRPEPLQAAIKITTGAGKSRYSREMIARYVSEARPRGLPHRVLVLVPTHALADEARQLVPAGTSTALWQGRTGKTIDAEEPVCLNPEAVEAALKVGLDVETTACRKGRKGQEILCPFYSQCGYQAQKPVAKAADVVFAAHEIGFNVPDAIGKDFGLVIIDEGFWQDGLARSRIAIRGLADELPAFPVRDHEGKKLDVETGHLGDLLDRLIKALVALPDGYVSRQSLIDAGLMPTTPIEPGSCTTARRYEWGRKIDPGLHPESDANTRREAAEKYGFLGQLPSRAAMWRALEELIEGDQDATGRLRIETTTTKEGTVRWLHIQRRVDLDDKVSGLPLINADATLNEDIARNYLPRLDMRLDLDVDAPHETITQVIGMPVGKASLRALPQGSRHDGEEKRVSNKRLRLRTVVERLTRGKCGLVITYKDVEADFTGIDGIETAHYNAIEGIDRWGDVEVLFIIGRPLPRPSDIQQMAAALTGRPIVAGDMAEAPIGIRLKNGAIHPLTKGRTYPDADAELIRKAVSESALLQAIGRARGVNRDASKPVDIFVIADDLALPVPIDAVTEFKDLEPDRIDRMLDAGIVPQMPTDAAKLYPDLFKTRQAAKHAYFDARLNVERGTKVVPRPYREISIRRGNQYRVKYRRNGRGQVSRLALVDESLIGNIRERLEAALGLLVEFEIEERPTEQVVEAVAPTPAPDIRPEKPDKPSRKPYHPDMFGALVIDIDGYRQGPIPPDLSERVRLEARSRGIRQDELAAEIEISPPQLCNALNGRFGLSAHAAERLIGWLEASA